MTAVIAPGLFPGLAPPAANAPPAQAGPPATGKTFAEAVAAVNAAVQQAGGDPEAPPGNPSAASTNPADTADLSLLLAGLIARLQGGVAGAGNGEYQTPLPDRPAGAGVEQTDVNAMEVLMAQLLLVRTPVQPDGTTAGAPAAPAAISPDAGMPDGAAEMPAGVVPVLAEMPLHATAQAGIDGGAAATPVATDTQANIDVATATRVAVAPHSTATQPAPSVNARQTATQPAPGVNAGQTATSAIPTAIAGASAASPVEDHAVVETAPAPADGDLAAVASSDGTGAPAVVTQAATDRPTPPTTGSRDRDTHGHAAGPATAATPPAAGAPQMQGEALAHATATARSEAPVTGPVTVQIANTVQSAVLRGEHAVRLVLNPPELGRVEINITETPQGIRVHLQTEQSGARELIERQLPLLQQALEARDLRVNRLEVSQTEQSGPAQWSLDSRGSGDGQRQQQGDGASPEWSPLAALRAGDPEPKRVALRAGNASPGGVDVMA